jgi:hypothetical protein
LIALSAAPSSSSLWQLVSRVSGAAWFLLPRAAGTVVPDAVLVAVIVWATVARTAVEEIFLLGESVRGNSTGPLDLRQEAAQRGAPLWLSN